MGEIFERELFRVSLFEVILTRRIIHVWELAYGAIGVGTSEWGH